MHLLRRSHGPWRRSWGGAATQGFFNYSQARCTADSFLGKCKRLVERAAFECRPGSSLALANGQRRRSAQSAGARLATKPDDPRLRAIKEANQSTLHGDRRADEERRQWATRRAGMAQRRVEAFNARPAVEDLSDDEYSESELMGQRDSIDPVAALVTV